MNKKRIFRASGILSIFIGLAMLMNGFSGITGFAIVENIVGTTSSVIGLVFLIGGIILFTLDEDYVKEYHAHHNEAHNASLFEKLKYRLRFKENQGHYPEQNEGWIIRYHAYPKNQGFRGKYLDESKCDDGFYMATTREAAREAVRIKDPNTELSVNPQSRGIDVVEIKIAKGVYETLKTTNVYDLSNGTTERIPKRKIKNVNKLIDKGLIEIK